MEVDEAQGCGAGPSSLVQGGSGPGYTRSYKGRSGLPITGVMTDSSHSLPASPRGKCGDEGGGPIQPWARKGPQTLSHGRWGATRGGGPNLSIFKLGYSDLAYRVIRAKANFGTARLGFQPLTPTQCSLWLGRESLLLCLSFLNPESLLFVSW